MYKESLNMSFNQTEYISNFNKKNYKMYQFRVKKSDSELIDLLDKLDNRNQFINSLLENSVNPGVLTIKQIKDKIRPLMAKHHIKDVYLFGSYSRGEANKDSDVDIYCEKGDVDSLIKASQFEKELEDALGKEVDVVYIGSQMDDYFKTHLEIDKIKIL